MKSYTDLEQSKVLSKILPLESADYCWGIDAETLHYNNSPYPCAWKDYTCKEYYIPCWSLAALLSVLPVTAILLKDGNISNTGDIKYNCQSSMINIHKWFDNSIDACYEMILKLHELNLL